MMLLMLSMIFAYHLFSFNVVSAAKLKPTKMLITNATKIIRIVKIIELKILE